MPGRETWKKRRRLSSFSPFYHAYNSVSSSSSSSALRAFPPRSSSSSSGAEKIDLWNFPLISAESSLATEEATRKVFVRAVFFPGGLWGSRFNDPPPLLRLLPLRQKRKRGGLERGGDDDTTTMV